MLNQCPHLPSECEDYFQYWSRHTQAKKVSLPLTHDEYHAMHRAAEQAVSAFEHACQQGDLHQADKLWPALSAFATRLLVHPAILRELRQRANQPNEGV